jgi:hypothetical protein
MNRTHFLDRPLLMYFPPPYASNLYFPTRYGSKIVTIAVVSLDSNRLKFEVAGDMLCFHKATSYGYSHTGLCALPSSLLRSDAVSSALLLLRLTGFIPSHGEISLEEKSNLRGPSSEICSLSGGILGMPPHRVVE